MSAPKKAKKVEPKAETTTATQPEEAAQEGNMLTTKEVAAKLDTDPKTLRKFLRSDISGIEAVGQGKRYAITPRTIPSLTKKFEKWAQAEAKAKANREKAAKAAPKQVEEPDEAAEVEELEELEVEVERGPGGCIDHTKSGDICKANAMVESFDDQGDPIYGDRCATHQKAYDKVQ